MRKGIKTKDAKTAAKDVAQLAKDLSSNLENLSVSPSESAEIVTDIANLVDELMLNPDVTDSQAKEVVSSAIESLLKGAVEQDEKGVNSVKLNKQAERMAKQAIKKAGRVKSESAKAIIKSEDIKSALDNAIDAVTNLKASLTKSGLTKAASNMRPVIDIEVSNTDDLKQIALDKDTVDALKESGAEVEIDMGDMTFRMPANLLEGFADSEVLVESEKTNNRTKASC